MKTISINFSDKGKCSGCGNCCSNYLPLTADDIHRIKRYIQRHRIKPVNHVIACAAERGIDGVCPFRDEDKGCLIYDVRPAICKIYNCAFSLEEIAAGFRGMGYAPKDFRGKDVRATFFPATVDRLESRIMLDAMKIRAAANAKGVWNYEIMARNGNA